MDKTFHNDLLAAIEDLTEALNKEKPAPDVVVEVPRGEAPKVEVAAPPASPAPDVTVNAPVNVPPRKPCAFHVEVTERDSQNFIKKLKITPAS